MNLNDILEARMRGLIVPDRLGQRMPRLRHLERRLPVLESLHPHMAMRNVDFLELALQPLGRDGPLFELLEIDLRAIVTLPGISVSLG